MTKVALADVLWDAANEHLLSAEFSCHAALYAYFRGRAWSNENPIEPFLASLGCDVERSGWHGAGRNQRLGIRYMWLLLAMHVAEDENILVEAS